MTSNSYINTGEIIPTEPDYLRGHGTILVNDELKASVCGFIEKVNKLISVRPLNSRYSGEIGDVIVGRIEDVGDKRWKVDINSKQHGILMLSSVNLPGNVQRRRTHADSLQMRNYFTESDLISAEVQSIKNDGSIHLHTRSLKYGKLEHGQLLKIPAVLIKRQKQHFHSLQCGVDVILGNNGYIWISATEQVKKYHQIIKEFADQSLESQIPQIPDVTSPIMRERVARVRNCIVALQRAHIRVYSNTIMKVYDTSIELGISTSQLLDEQWLYRLVQSASDYDHL